MKNQDYINELLGRYFSREPLTREEQKELEEWRNLHQEEFNKLERLITFTDTRIKHDATFNTEAAWEKIKPRLKSRTKKTFRLWPSLIAAAAAMITIWVGIKMYYPEIPALRLENQTASIQRHMLPDSSEVILFPGTQITCHISQTDGERKVRMNGKAFFEVKKNAARKFVVKTNDISIEVLGTSFTVDGTNIRNTRVMVRSGKVRVSTDEANVELIKNQQVEISDNKIQIKPLDSDQEFDFANGLLIVRNKPLEYIVKQIELTTGNRIIIENSIGNDRITSRFDLNDMEQVVAELAYLCNCLYEKTDSTQYRLYHDKK